MVSRMLALAVALASAGYVNANFGTGLPPGVSDSNFASVVPSASVYGAPTASASGSAAIYTVPVAALYKTDIPLTPVASGSASGGSVFAASGTATIVASKTDPAVSGSNVITGSGLAVETFTFAPTGLVATAVAQTAVPSLGTVTVSGVDSCSWSSLLSSTTITPTASASASSSGSASALPTAFTGYAAVCDVTEVQALGSQTSPPLSTTASLLVVPATYDSSASTFGYYSQEAPTPTSTGLSPQLNNGPSNGVRFARERA